MRGPIALLTLTLIGCSGESSEPASGGEESGLRHDKGVDVEKKVIKVGALDDLSGPAAAIGKHFANGKRLLAAQINAGGSGLLPDGWTVELVERDHGYNPQQSVQSYDQIRDEVLFVGTSFGTPNTMPLRPKLEEDNMIAFPASLSSLMEEHPFTPPLGASYKAEAMRGIDFVASQTDDPSSIKIGVVYQQDDFGKDVLNGATQAAAAYGIEVVSEQSVSPGQSEMTALVTGLKDAGATHVLLGVLPSSAGPVLGTAAKLEYGPMWLGTTASWLDLFFSEKSPLPSAVFANYYQAGSLPYWGEERKGMTEFEGAFAAHGEGMSPDFFVLLSYAQGLVGVEAARRAIEGGDITREGYVKALRSMTDFDAGGLTNTLDLSGTPYQVTEEVRVLKPDFEAKSWTVVMPYATPGKPDTAGAAEGAAPAEAGEGSGE